jgi:glycosyltransferase involved in cell wall biosynthesis
MSELDAQRLRELAPGSSTIVVPNGVDTEYFGLRTEQPIPGRIVFIGPTYLFPNRDAVDHLVTAIWPRVRHVLPHATLHLIGGGPPSLLSRYSSIPGVTALGRVPDVRPHVGAACCPVVPIRVGGRTRIKIVESWSMGRAVVSTSLGCEGLACTDDLHLLVRDNPAHFADAIIQLVQDDPRRLRLAAEGKRLVDERYSWNSIGSAMTQEYLRLISGG